MVNADGTQAADVHIKDGKILTVAPNIKVTGPHRAPMLPLHTSATQRWLISASIRQSSKNPRTHL